MRLLIENAHVKLLIQEARRVSPVEACALIFGNRLEDSATIRKVVMTDNMLQSPKRFEISVETALDSMATAENEGLEFLGFFHSHPAPATPSEVDRKFMRLWGDAVWLILSMTDGNLNAFQMEDGEVQQITIRVHI